MCDKVLSFMTSIIHETSQQQLKDRIESAYLLEELEFFLSSQRVLEALNEFTCSDKFMFKHQVSIVYEWFD